MGKKPRPRTDKYAEIVFTEDDKCLDPNTMNKCVVKNGTEKDKELQKRIKAAYPQVIADPTYKKRLLLILVSRTNSINAEYTQTST